MKFIKLLLSPVVALIRYIVVHTKPQTNPLTLIELVRHQALKTSAQYIQKHIEFVMLFNQRQMMWLHALKKISPYGICAEFGVYSGYSINYFARTINDRVFYGFDSFEGLREDSIGTDLIKGTFDLKGKLPKVQNNVTLIQGWFSDTLPNFLEKNSENFAFIHFDADTYESTSYLLNTIRKRIVSGTVIIFDEYLGLPNWENGEFLAWKEFVAENSIRYRYLGFSNQQAAIQIL